MKQFLRQRAYNAAHGLSAVASVLWPKSKSALHQMSILFVANDLIPTLEIHFLVPLAPLVQSKKINYQILTERDVKRAMGAGKLKSTIANCNPDIIVFCRYSGCAAAEILEEARAQGAATIFQIDDDLLNVPKSFGQKKFEFHNDPARLSAVRLLLEHCDLVYAANERLLATFGEYVPLPISVASKINCATTIYRRPERTSAASIGYMGFDHADDFALVAPAILVALKTFPHATFTMIGPIPIPESFSVFGDRVKSVPPIRDYKKFRQRLADEFWDIGLCPLLNTPFNLMKSNIKWVEYTASGMATIASAGTIYDQCCSDDCGVLVENRSDAWIDALQGLLMNDARRYAIAQRAQEKVRVHYAPDVLTRQVQDVLQLALKVRSEKTASAHA